MGSLSLIEGPRRWWLPAPAQAVLVSPAPLPASLCVHSEECTQMKFLRDLFLLAGKGRGEAGCPCPWPRKWQRNPVGPGWSGPGASYTWDPVLGAGVPRACCKDTVSCSRAVLVGLPWRGTTAPKDLTCACSRRGPSFAASAMLQGRLESIGPTPAHGAGSKGSR